MKSYNLSEDKIKICLTEDEIEILFGSFDLIDYDSPKSRAIIDSLICGALPERVDLTACDKVLIEVSPERNGCSIQVTRIYDKGRRSPEKARRREYILLFNNSEDLTDYICSLNPIDIQGIISNSLYRMGNKFALYICAETTSGFIQYVCEFGKIFRLNSTAGAAVLEHGKLLYHGAVEKIYKTFKVRQQKETP